MVQAASVRLVTESRYAWTTDARSSATIWTAASTQPVLGNGTLVSRYRLTPLGTCEWRLELTAGTTTTFGTGQWQMPTPFTVAQQSGGPMPIGGCVHSGTRHGIWASLTVPNINLQTVTTSFPTNNVTGTVPFAWATGDVLSFSFSFEV